MNSEDLTNAVEIYDRLPFMQSFPFEEYEISLQEEEGKSAKNLGINPIIASTFSELELGKRVNFSYIEEDSTLMVSFYEYDLKYIELNQQKIKKMDSVRLILEKAIVSTDLEEKTAAIKKGKNFIKLFDSEILNTPAFESILLDICDIKEIGLSTDIMLELHKLNLKNTLTREELTKKEKEAISAYLNFQLHYARIILGIVIAAKIY